MNEKTIKIVIPLKMIGLPSKVGIRTSGCDQSAHTSDMATSQTSLGLIKPSALLGNLHNDVQGRQIIFSMTGALAGTPITSLLLTTYFFHLSFLARPHWISSRMGPASRVILYGVYNTGNVVLK